MDRKWGVCCRYFYFGFDSNWVKRNNVMCRKIERKEKFVFGFFYFIILGFKYLILDFVILICYCDSCIEDKSLGKSCFLLD